MSRVLKNFIITLKKDVQKSLQTEEQKKAAKHGRSANGNSKLWGTIKTGISPSDDPNNVQMYMNEYWFWVDGGRKPGKVSSSKLTDWVKRKGLNPSKIIDDMRAKYNAKHGLEPPKKKTPFAKAQKQVAFLAARKIKVKGFPANHFYTAVINDGRLDRLAKDLLEEQGKEIITSINVSNSNK